MRLSVHRRVDRHALGRRCVSPHAMGQGVSASGSGGCLPLGPEDVHLLGRHPLDTPPRHTPWTLTLSLGRDPQDTHTPTHDHTPDTHPLDTYTPRGQTPPLDTDTSKADIPWTHTYPTTQTPRRDDH